MDLGYDVCFGVGLFCGFLGRVVLGVFFVFVICGCWVLSVVGYLL